MKIELNRFALTNGVATLIILLLLMIGPSCDLIVDRPPPTDDYLEQAFTQNRTEFENLISMAREDDNLIVVSHRFTVTKSNGVSSDSGVVGISDARWRQYKELFKKLNLEAGILKGEDGSVQFNAFVTGLGVSGMTKGYIFSTSEFPRGNFRCSEQTLDAPFPLNGRPFACKTIDDNWYIFVSQ